MLYKVDFLSAIEVCGEVIVGHELRPRLAVSRCFSMAGEVFHPHVCCDQLDHGNFMPQRSVAVDGLF